MAKRCSRTKHKAIRKCKNCKHTPRINRKNPSAGNHHGKGSFCRYHWRQPLGRKYCTSQGKPKNRR